MGSGQLMDFKGTSLGVSFSSGVCLQRQIGDPSPPQGRTPHLALGRTLGQGWGWGIEHPGFPSKASRLSCPQERFLEDGFQGHMVFDSSAVFVFVCVCVGFKLGKGREKETWITLPTVSHLCLCFFL